MKIHCSERAKTLCDAVKKDGKYLLNFTPEFTPRQAAMNQEKQLTPLSNFPDVDTESLLLSSEECLSTL